MCIRDRPGTAQRCQARRQQGAHEDQHQAQRAAARPAAAPAAAQQGDHQQPQARGPRAGREQGQPGA
eukprot:3440649-Alexandrium_andersonii.AAC.1